MSQAPGLRGTPDSGHCSSAATRASWASSSARPTSRTIRARPAMSLADSILQTASIARWVSEAVMTTDHTIFDPPVQAQARRGYCPGRQLDASTGSVTLLGGRLGAQAFFLLPEFGSERGTEVRRLEHLADFDLGPLERGALEPLDRLFLRLHLPQPEAGDQLLRLGEGPVDHGPLPTREPDARALRAGVKPLCREQHARFHQLLVESSHLGQEFLAGENARLRVLVSLDQHHESHLLSFWFQVRSWAPGRSSTG